MEDTTKKQSTLQYMLRFPADGQLRDKVRDTAHIYGQSINSRLLSLIQKGLDSEDQTFLLSKATDESVLTEVRRRFPQSTVTVSLEVRLSDEQFTNIKARQQKIDADPNNHDLEPEPDKYPNEDKYLNKGGAKN